MSTLYMLYIEISLRLYVVHMTFALWLMLLYRSFLRLAGIKDNSDAIRHNAKFSSVWEYKQN